MCESQAILADVSAYERNSAASTSREHIRSPLGIRRCGELRDGEAPDSARPLHRARVLSLAFRVFSCELGGEAQARQRSKKSHPEGFVPQPQVLPQAALLGGGVNTPSKRHILYTHSLVHEVDTFALVLSPGFETQDQLA